MLISILFDVQIVLINLFAAGVITGLFPRWLFRVTRPAAWVRRYLLWLFWLGVVVVATVDVLMLLELAD